MAFRKTKKSSVSRRAATSKKIRFQWWMAVILVGVIVVAGVAIIRLSHASGIDTTEPLTDWTWKTTGFTTMEWVITPRTDPVGQGIFWSNQFIFDGTSKNGYIGLQANSPKFPNQPKTAIFSIWGATGATGPGIAQP